jgi:hypothetical protein
MRASGSQRHPAQSRPPRLQDLSPTQHRWSLLHCGAHPRLRPHCRRRPHPVSPEPHTRADPESGAPKLQWLPPPQQPQPHQPPPRHDAPPPRQSASLRDPLGQPKPPQKPPAWARAPPATRLRPRFCRAGPSRAASPWGHGHEGLAPAGQAGPLAALCSGSRSPPLRGCRCG